MDNKKIWGITVILAMICIFAGYKITTSKYPLIGEPDYAVERAVVVSIEKQVNEDGDVHREGEDPCLCDEDHSLERTSLIFIARIISGKNDGTDVKGVQVDDRFTPLNEKKVAIGDQILLFNVHNGTYGTEWVFGAYYRQSKLIMLALIFFMLIILLGGMQGVKTLISLVITCCAVFFVFVPSILSGYNIYIGTALTCFFTITTTLIITNGTGIKTTSTILGCIFGVIVAAIFAAWFNKTLGLSGYTRSESIALTMLDVPVAINLNAIIFAGIVIGALGAVMDVAMDIASSMYEIKSHVPDISPGELFKSGITIGRDIMGTMANTLVLAYIGSSLSTVLILIVSAQSVTELMNREMIVVEVLQALIGSTAILLTIPLTAAVSALLFTEMNKE